MNFSKHFLFVAAAFLFVFVRQSDASLLGSIVSAVDSGLSSLLNSLDKTISEGIQHTAYYLIKNDFLEIAAKAGDDESNRIILKAVDEAMDLVRGSADVAFDGLRAASSSTASPEVSIQNLRTAFNSSREYLLAGGVKAYLALGALTAINNEGAKQGLNEAVQIVTELASIAFNGLDDARDLAIQGIAAGKEAAVQGILTGFKGVQATEEEIYNLTVKCALRVYAALLNQLLPVSVNSQVTLEKDQAAAASPQCQKTIRAIDEFAKISSGGISSETKLKGIKIIRDSLIDASKTIAHAEKNSCNALDRAKLILNKELALALAKNGFESSKKECISAVSIAQQAFGAAAKIVGKDIEAPIVNAILNVEKGTAELLRGLDKSYMIASQGILNNVSQKALSAAMDGVATAVDSAYTNILKSAALSFTGIVLA